MDPITLECSNPKCPFQGAAPCTDADSRLLFERQEVGRMLNAELRRFAFTQREQAVAEVILDFSYGNGLTSVLIPKLDLFRDLTGITRGNVHETLRRLHEMRVVSVKGTQGGPVYRVNPKTADWACRTRISHDSIQRAAAMIKGVNRISTQAEREFSSDMEAVLDAAEISDPNALGKKYGLTVPNCEPLRRGT